MKLLKCTVSYVGNRYDGWQSQKSRNGIQDILEVAISRIENRKVSITGSGRTDAGVSARAQVFMFETDRDMSSFRWMGAINAFLPEDIHIMDVQEVPYTFHARHSVRMKKYTYRVNDGPYDVFTKDTAYQYCHPLDIDRMKACAKLFVGTHDFTSFNSSPLSEYPNQVRTIRSIEIIRNGNLIEMTFCGKGFLRYMVRMLSAAIIDVGSGRITCDDVISMLEQKNKRAGRRNAPACGLTLEEVDYLDRVVVTPCVQIREFLYDEPLPYDSWDRMAIEHNCRTKTGNRVYLFCRGIDMEQIGYFLMSDEETVLVIRDEKLYDTALLLRASILAWMMNEGVRRDLMIMLQRHRDDSGVTF